MKHGESARTIVIALVANVVIAVAKLVAGIVSGSTAMLAESAHSFADSLNEVLLGFSLHRAQRPPDATHPLGHGRERFLWALMAAIASFLIGGCFSAAMAIHALTTGGETERLLTAWIVLAISFVAEGISWVQSLKQARNEARERGRSVWVHLIRSSDPIVRAVVVEDAAALIGIILAAGGLLVSTWTGTNTPDSVASLLIGVLLAATAFGLARPLADFLIGHSLTGEQLDDLRAVILASPAIDEVVSLQAVFTGPEEVIVAAKVHPSSKLQTQEIAKAMDDLDHALRKASPFVADVYLDLTAYRAEKTD